MWRSFIKDDDRQTFRLCLIKEEERRWRNNDKNYVESIQTSWLFADIMILNGNHFYSPDTYIHMKKSKLVDKC